MPAITLFERRMEKALHANQEAMFSVPLGDSHRHAFVKGVREGLQIALKAWNDEIRSDSEDGV